MNKTKLKVGLFTIADHEEEETWLRSQHQKGWKLKKVVPYLYTFEQCEPEDVIYRLDYKNADATDDYMQMYSDFGWDCLGKCVGWYYFCKPAAQIDGEKEGELFSDNESKVDMLQRVIQTRMLPIILIFLAFVLPQTVRVLSGKDGVGLLILCLVVLALYLFLLLHCGLKLLKLKKKYKEGE
jgi:hypothetical protein